MSTDGADAQARTRAEKLALACEEIIATLGCYVPGGWAHPGDEAAALVEAILLAFAEGERGAGERREIAALKLLAMLYDKYEDGPACFEKPETFDVYIGNAVRLTGEEEAAILAMLPKERHEAIRARGSRSPEPETKPVCTRCGNMHACGCSEEPAQPEPPRCRYCNRTAIEHPVQYDPLCSGQCQRFVPGPTQARVSPRRRRR